MTLAAGATGAVLWAAAAPILQRHFFSELSVTLVALAGITVVTQVLESTAKACSQGYDDLGGSNRIILLEELLFLPVYGLLLLLGVDPYVGMVAVPPPGRPADRHPGLGPAVAPRLLRRGRPALGGPGPAGGRLRLPGPARHHRPAAERPARLRHRRSPRRPGRPRHLRRRLPLRRAGAAALAGHELRALPVLRPRRGRARRRPGAGDDSPDRLDPGRRGRPHGPGRAAGPAAGLRPAVPRGRRAGRGAAGRAGPGRGLGDRQRLLLGHRPAGPDLDGDRRRAAGHGRPRPAADPALRRHGGRGRLGRRLPGHGRGAAGLLPHLARAGGRAAPAEAVGAPSRQEAMR